MKHNKIFFKKLGAFLKWKRIDSEITQKEIANICKIGSIQFISNIERGLCAPSDPVLVKMVKTYKIQPQEIVVIILAAQKSKYNKLLKIKESI